MEEVEKVFVKIKNLIGAETFKRIFEVILTDNGSEFFNPISIEIDYTLVKFYLIFFIVTLIVPIRRVLLKKIMNISDTYYPKNLLLII